MLLILCETSSSKAHGGCVLERFLYVRDRLLGAIPDSPLAIKIHQFTYRDKMITYQNSYGSLRSL